MPQNQELIRQNPKRNHLFLFRDWRLFLYNLAILIFSPYLLLNKLYRTIHKRNWSYFIPARCTTPTFGVPDTDPEAVRLVFMCSALGEILSCIKLTNALKEIYPELQVIIAVREFADVAAIQRQIGDVPVSFYPFDFWPFVKPWIKKTKPDVVIAMRLLWFPNIAWASQLWGASMCAIGVPPRKYKPTRFKLWSVLNRWTLRGYDAVGFLTKEDKQDHLALFDKNAKARVTGSTRFVIPRSLRPESYPLKQWIEHNNPEKLPLIVTGSLRRGEPEFILDAFQTVRSHRDCLLLMAPRRLDKVKEFEELLQQHNINYSLRSHYDASHPLSTHPEVLILDTIGELSDAYGFGQVAYVGGTLHGVGHNIYEPLEWEVPVCFGHGDGKIHVSHTPAVEAGVGFRVNSSKDLADEWLHILTDSQFQKLLKERCQLFMKQQQEHFQNHVQLLVDMIELRKDATNNKVSSTSK